jgi:hypothetical protein
VMADLFRPKNEVATPLKSIRRKCLECCCGVFKEVELCPIEKCWLWPYRMGRRPK